MPIRKRVLIIEPAGLLWGSERALIDLLRELDRSRFDVTVACPPSSPLLPHLQAIGIATESLPLASLHTRGAAARVGALLAITRLLARLRPDVLHLNQSGIVKISAIAAALFRIPIVAHVRIQEDVELLLHKVHKRLAPRAAIAISADIATRLAPSGSEVRLIYDPFAVTRPARSRSAVRALLGIPLDSPLLCIASRLGPGKGHNLLLSALKLLPDQSVRLVVAGGDAPPDSEGVSYADGIRRKALDLALANRVIFTGQRNDVIDILAASDLAILPSDNEPFGRVLLEALSLGVPVVASDAGGPREIIGRNERGFLFTPGDPASLAAAIEEALTNRDEATRRTAAGNAWVLEHCSPALHAREVEALYDLVAER